VARTTRIQIHTVYSLVGKPEGRDHCEDLSVKNNIRIHLPEKISDVLTVINTA
jgi:hypothetical protein